MSRRILRARVDDNQARIVAALRAAGATVHSTATVGKGFPDLAVGYRGITYLFEVKDGQKPPSRRRLSDDEDRWQSSWRGHCATVTNEQEALREIGAV